MENKLSKRFGRRIRRNVEGRTGVGWGTRIRTRQLKTAGNLGVFSPSNTNVGALWEHVKCALGAGATITFRVDHSSEGLFCPLVVVGILILL